MLDLNNNSTLIGNAGGVAELRKTTTGRDVANFSIATQSSNSRKDPNTGEWLEKKTEWHRVVAWGPTALYVHNNLKKGSQVKMMGHLVTRKWTKKIKVEGGETLDVDMESTEIHVDQISITNPKRNTQAPQGEDYNQDNSEFPMEDAA